VDDVRRASVDRRRRREIVGNQLRYEEAGLLRHKPAGVWVGLLATADRDYVFSGWTGDCSGTEASYTLALTGPRTCGATFAGNK
jgi:uncharacterized repeat protein (TIGR02543 family)